MRQQSFGGDRQQRVSRNKNETINTPDLTFFYKTPLIVSFNVAVHLKTIFPELS